MKEVSIDTINDFIKSKGGSVSVQELSEYLMGSDKIIFPDKKPIGQTRISPEHLRQSLNPKLFEKFNQCIAREPNKILTASDFQKRLDERNIEFYYLKEFIELTTGAILTAVVIDKKTGEKQFMRDYFVRRVPLDYRSRMEYDATKETVITKKGRPFKNKI